MLLVDELLPAELPLSETVVATYTKMHGTVTTEAQISSIL